MKTFFILILSAVVFQRESVANPIKPGCPLSIDIKPCVCTNSPYTYLQCKHLDDAEVLRNIFLNSTKYQYKEVHIEYSTMTFLPHNIFGIVPVTELHLKNVTLTQLFDAPPENTFLDSLDVLHIENTKLIRGVIWELLEPLTHLRILNIYYNNIKTIGSDFSEHATKELKQLSFYATATKTIKPGVFQKFVNLEKVAVDNGKLKKISRDIFPTPFNVRVLYFGKNNLETIPDDMFTNMPYLQTVGLRDNKLAVIPERAFQGSFSKLEYLILTGNPIICDCRLAFLIKNKPPALWGTCDLPSKFQGKELAELDSADFNC